MWSATERGVPVPILKVSGLEHVAQQPQEPVIMYLVAKYFEHNRMIESVETLGDVRFN